MPKSPTRPPSGEPPAGEAERSRPAPDAAIRAGVLTALGSPPSLFRVAVQPLWRGYYRVNVLTGADITTVRIAHSYFVEAGESGNIIAATPLITRVYT